MNRKLRRKEQREVLLRQQQALLVGFSAEPKPSIGQMVLQQMKVQALPDATMQPTVHENQDAWPPTWPKCPATCDPMEWRRALENKEFYELKQIEDNGSKPWFQYPRHSYQYSEFVYCTPEMATVLLEYMPTNRPQKPSWIDAIKRDILNDRWLQTHESIAINKLGSMHDGQHRAKGIIESGKAWPIYFTWNVPPEAIYVTDSGEKRKINEKLGFLFPNQKIDHKTAALCRAMMWGLSARGLRYSESEIADFAVKYKDVLAWITYHLRGYRADFQAVIGKSLLWWGEDIVGSFIQKIKNVDFDGDGDPAKTLYLWMTKSRKEGRRSNYAAPTVHYKKTLSAIAAHAEERTNQKLYQRKTDLFEWLPGWEVPADAPCGGKVLNNPVAETEETKETDSK